jgi:hypothetical protein
MDEQARGQRTLSGRYGAKRQRASNERVIGDVLLT